MLAGIGTSWYVALEQGRDITVSANVLNAISSALRLSPLERDYLYRLAGVSPPQAVLREMPTAEWLTRLVDHWMPSPAHVIDQYWDILATNRSAREVFGFTAEDHNCLVSFFVNRSYRERIGNWDELALNLVAEFRRDVARFPENTRCDRLAARLQRISPEFADLWARHEVTATTRNIKEVNHAAIGRLVFDSITLHLPDRPDIRLILHTPRSGTSTGHKVAGLLGRPDTDDGAQAAGIMHQGPPGTVAVSAPQVQERLTPTFLPDGRGIPVTG